MAAVEFFPASPLREPFASLFAAAPAEGLAVVRQITKSHDNGMAAIV